MPNGRPKQNYIFVSGIGSAQASSESGPADISPANEKSRILSHVQARRRQRERQSLLDLKRHPAKSGSESSASEIQSQQVHSRILVQKITSGFLSRTYPSNNWADPFHSTAVGRDAQVHFNIQYEFTDCHHHAYLGEAFAPEAVIKGKRPSLPERAVERFRQCVRDPMLMYSTLALASSFVGWGHGQIREDVDPEYYIGKAIPAVLARMKDPLLAPKDKWILDSVHHLAATQLWNGIPELWANAPTRAKLSDPRCLEACRMHLRAFCALVEGLGGWDSVDGELLEGVLFVDKYLALYTLSKPVVPLAWDPGPRPGAKESGTQSLPQLGRKLLDLIESQDLYEILLGTVDFTRAAADAWTGRASLPISWLSFRHQALVHRLLRLDGLNSQDTVVRLAMMLFFLHSTMYRGAQIGAVELARQMRVILTHSLSGPDISDTHLVFWITCTAAMASLGNEDGAWLMKLTKKTAYSIGLDITVESFRGELESFLYLDINSAAHLESLVKQMT